jgi:hypothetical protein
MSLKRQRKAAAKLIPQANEPRLALSMPNIKLSENKSVHKISII